MNIAIITPYNKFYGGVESVNKLIYDIFIEYGHSVDIISLDNYEKSKKDLFFEKIIGQPWITSEIFMNIQKIYDVVICNGEFSYGIQHSKCINIFHGSYYGLRKALSRYCSFRDKFFFRRYSLLQKIGSKDKYVISVSKFLSNVLQEQGIAVNEIISNCVDTNIFYPEYSNRTEKYIFVGSYNYYGKGFDILEKLAQRGLDIDCVTNCYPGKNLGWIQNIDNKELSSLYNRYRMLIFPSRFEASGLVPIEALACGLPILMGRVGIGIELECDIPEFVIDFSKEDSTEECFRRINLINSNYNYFMQKSRSYAEKNHSLIQFKNNWLKLLEDIGNDKLGY
jgi:glycosyltransferase involved in cell wall biosynthesis